MARTTLLTLLVTLGAMAAAMAEAFSCPDAACRCGLDGRGRLKAVCDRGELMDPIPVRQMDPLTEVLIISAPQQRPNYLTIGPIFQGLLKLEELKITNSFIPAIGKHSFWGLRSLRLLDLSGNNISSLVDSNFRGLVSVEELYLNDNVIDSVPSATFRHLPSLKRLNVARNRMDAFVPRFFYGLHRLEELDLSDNPLGDLEPEVFRDVRLLQSLRCRRCRLNYINPLLLHLLPDLQLLDLGCNNFHYLEKKAFNDLKHLKHLYLDGNQLTVVTSAVFTGQNLTTLSLADNKIVTMDPSVFVNVNVSDLDVSHNRIQSLHPVLLSSLNRTLRSLKIGGNRLQASHLWSAVLSPGVGLNLRVLDVSDMALGPSDQHFQLDLFSFQKHLKSLNVSGTQLDLLPVEMVRSLPALKELDLSRNQLTSLTDETVHVLASLLHLRRVELYGNPWYCDACVIGPLLKWLDASPSTRHIKEGCRGLRTNAANASDAASDALCPVCHNPSSVAGVELPRLDHVNLPSSCNYPPTLIDSGDLPSKVQASPASDQAPFQLFANPIYTSLVCGSLTLIVVAVCAALAVVTRHAASYYTHEDVRGVAGAQDPLCSDQKKKKKNKKKTTIVSSSSSSSSSSSEGDQHKNNNGQMKASSTSSPVRVHRGVHCNTTNGHLTNVAVYPMTSFDSQLTDQRPLC